VLERPELKEANQRKETGPHRVHEDREGVEVWNPTIASKRRRGRWAGRLYLTQSRTGRCGMKSGNATKRKNQKWGGDSMGEK